MLCGLALRHADADANAVMLDVVINQVQHRLQQIQTQCLDKVHAFKGDQWHCGAACLYAQHVISMFPGEAEAGLKLLMGCMAGASLHVCMSPHGPDVASYTASIDVDTRVPQRLPSSTMAFMFEVSQTPRVMLSALHSPAREQDYLACWIGLKKAGIEKENAAGMKDDAELHSVKAQKHAFFVEARGTV